MNGREALEALERAACSYKENTPVTAHFLGHLIRGVLAEPAAVPATCNQVTAYEQMNGWWSMPPAEYNRLRAWEAWGREHAVPALETVPKRKYDFERWAEEALAAAPRQEKP